MCDSNSGFVFTPQGYQGPAQHTYTPACAGFHAPGPCPPSTSAQITVVFDYVKGAYIQEDTS